VLLTLLAIDDINIHYSFMIKSLLQTLIVSILFVQSPQLLGQCETGRYRDFIFENFQLASDIAYGSNLLYNGTESTLLLDVYTPVGDQENLRPLVIMLHGGFFVTGDKTGTDIAPACGDLARMGYVASSINYRLGFPVEFDLSGPMSEAVLRAVHDLKAAVRFFRKSVAEDGNPFGIDVSHIYVGGLSAGGFASLHAAYMQEDEIPAAIDLSEPGLDGGIEGNSGNTGYSSYFNAVLSIAGAIVDTTYIEANDMPACLFHGTNDATVPYGSDMLVIAGLWDVTEVDGSYSIDQKLNQLGINHCFEIYEGQGHVPSVTQPAYYDTTLSIISNFLSHFVCDAELDCSYRDITTSQNELTAKSAMKIWPNPADNILNILFNDEASCPIQVFNTTGQLIMTTPKASSGQTLQLDISNLSSGFYLLKRMNDQSTWNQAYFIVE
jgi:para-nitrobenzyl esterase